MYVPEGGTRTVIEVGGSSEIISGLSAGTTYEIRVSACNAVGFGNWSAGATIETASASDTPGGNTLGDPNNNWCGVAQAGSNGTPGTPNPPTSSSKTENSIAVSWTAPANDGGSEIKMYAVQWTPSGGASQMEKVMTGMSHTITGLDADTAYTVQVAACNAVGMSNWSPGLVIRTDQGSAQSNVVPQPTTDPNNGDSGSDGSDDVADCNSEDSDRDCYEIIVTGTCGAGTWQGHTHDRNGGYWGGTVGCLSESLINSIDPADENGRSRMWTKSKMSDHKHPGYSDKDHSNHTSCNSAHAAFHVNHTPLSCTSQ